jgi:hypothetical protein
MVRESINSDKEAVGYDNGVKLFFYRTLGIIIHLLVQQGIDRNQIKQVFSFMVLKDDGEKSRLQMSFELKNQTNLPNMDIHRYNLKLVIGENVNWPDPQLG